MLKTKFDLIWRFYYENKKSNAAQSSDKEQIKRIETIITRCILNTRPRDFYDVYILTKTQEYNAETLRKAIFATAEHRGTKAIMEAETNNRLAVIENSSELQSQWAKYQKKFPYAKDITYQETVNAVKEVIHEVLF